MDISHLLAQVAQIPSITPAVIVIPAQAGSTVTAQFNYYPDLPVMELELILNGNIFGLDGALASSVDSTQFPGNIGFDTTYAYQILPSAPYNIYDVSFYKNPASSTYPSYVAKTNSNIDNMEWVGLSTILDL